MLLPMHVQPEVFPSLERCDRIVKIVQVPQCVVQKQQCLKDMFVIDKAPYIYLPQSLVKLCGFASFWDKTCKP